MKEPVYALTSFLYFKILLIFFIIFFIPLTMDLICSSYSSLLS